MESNQPETIGRGLVIATAWLAGLGYASALVLRLRTGRWSTTGAGCWLGGACAMLIHVLLAFHFRHDWSHAAAVADTIRQTKELLGWGWGGGVWLNYLLVALWLTDAVRLWISPASHQNQDWRLAAGIHGFLAFMWFNGTIVFGSWPARVFGIVVLMILAGTFRQGRARERVQT